jgi:hypothetical protein
VGSGSEEWAGWEEVAMEEEEVWVVKDLDSAEMADWGWEEAGWGWEEGDWDLGLNTDFQITEMHTSENRNLHHNYSDLLI